MENRWNRLLLEGGHLTMLNERRSRKLCGTKLAIPTDGYAVSMLRKVGIEVTKFFNLNEALNDEGFKERNSFTNKGMTASSY